jgi:hypothetical protein
MHSIEILNQTKNGSVLTSVIGISNAKRRERKENMV